MNPVDTPANRAFLSTLTEPGQAFEIRILDALTPGAYRPQVLSGFFDDTDAAVKTLSELRLATAGGIYVTLNPVNSALLARTHNRLSAAKSGGTTSDRDIARRRWLLIDIDPTRPSGVSATDIERDAAFTVGKSVMDFLRAREWPDPIQVDSGNGVHLYYRVELPAETSVVTDCLKVLDRKCSTDQAKVDVSVGNPARIVKIPGTWACKGDDAPELGRPHRLSQIIRVPDQLIQVDTALLSALADELPPPATVPPAGTTDRSGKSWSQAKLQEFIDTNLADCKPQPPRPYRDGHIWGLDICPFNPAHDDKTATVTRSGAGVLGFRCLHDSCRDYHWKELRAKFATTQHNGHTVAPVIDESDPDFDLVTRHGPPVHYDGAGHATAVNEMFLAALFAKHNLVLHEPVIQRFYMYDADTGLWTQRTEAYLRVQLTALIRQTLKDRGAEVLERKVTNTLAQNVLRLLQGVVERRGVFDNRKPVIHVANGVLELKDGKATLVPFSSEFYSRNRSEIAYVAEATCPRFLKNLLEPALSADDISLVQRYAGQCLIGTNLSQRLLLLRGTPGGGKSTVVTVLESIIGQHNVTQLRVPLLTQRFETASFVGKTVLTGKDVPSDFLNADAAHVIKALVGGDRMDAELKHGRDRLPLKGDFNLIVTSNCRLHVHLDSDIGAWRRRLLIVDFEKIASAKPIPDFAGVLVKEEGPGILNWLVQGALQLLQELEATGRPAMTELQTKRVEDLLCESDSVRQFVKQVTVKTTGADVTVAETQQAYHDFADQRGWTPVPERQFQRQIRDVMMEEHRATFRTDIKRNDKNQRGFSGVALNPTAHQEPDEAA